MIKLKIKSKIIYFDEELHKFYDEEKKKILSVTECLGVLDKSNFLIPWAIGLMKDYLMEKIENRESITKIDIKEASLRHRKSKKEAADIGTKIHQWINRWIRNKHTKIPEERKVRNGIIAFLEFQRKNKFQWLESEKIVYSAKLNYAGILDAVAKTEDGLILVDFKSSKNFYPEFNFQTAAYKFAYEEMTNKPINSRLIIRFDKETGEFEEKELSDKDYDNDIKIFESCKIIKTLSR